MTEAVTIARRERIVRLRRASQAWSDYGRQRHPANLDFADCFSYALAKTLGEPLLFKGHDFSLTDISPAV